MDILSQARQNSSEDRKDKKRLKEHVLAHHIGLDLTSFEGVPSNLGVVKKVDALIGEYNRSDASSVVNFFEKEHHSQPNTPERDFALWVMINCKSSIQPNSKVLPFCSGTFCILSLSYQVTSIQEKWCTDRWNSSGQKQEKG